jgi:hypothetical protein
VTASHFAEFIDSGGQPLPNATVDLHAKIWVFWCYPIQLITLCWATFRFVACQTLVRFPSKRDQGLSYSGQLSNCVSQSGIILMFNSLKRNIIL